MPTVVREKADSDDEREDQPYIAWCGVSKTIPVILFVPEAVVSKDKNICSIGEYYNLSFKIVRTESRLVRGILVNHGFQEVHPNSNDFNLMWTGSHLKPYALRNLQDFQKVNHFPRSYELTRKDRLYKNIQRMQQTYGFKHFHIIPQTFVLPSEYQDFCNGFTKDKGPWIIKPVASSRGRGIYLVSNPNQISVDENILVSRYINNPLLIDDFKFDMRLYVLVTSYDPLLIYVYEEGLARLCAHNNVITTQKSWALRDPKHTKRGWIIFATVKYDRTSVNIRNTFMHLTNYSVNKKSGDYVSCDDPEVEDYGNKWSMSAVLRYLKQEGKDTTLLMSQIEDLIIKALLSAEQHIASACRTHVPHKTNCFELYGFDVLVDSNLKPWLLEVNLSPSLSCDAPLDLKIKASMIADMFSLVGFVCQDPLPKQARSDKVLAAQPPAVQRAQRHKVISTINSEADPQGYKHGKGDSTLSLSTEEMKVLRRIREEYDRRGGFIRIFPTPDTWELYSGFLESRPSMNFMLATRLFHGRNVNENVQLQVDTVHESHVIQYERKLLSLEARKKRQRHPNPGSSRTKKAWGKKSKACLTESSSQEAEECTPKEKEEVRLLSEPALHKQKKQVASSMELCHGGSLSSSGAAMHNARPKINLLSILEQGWNLSKVQARIAFSAYLHRVQQRLLAESRANSVPAWPDRDNDQMELVIRFLRRAARNLQQELNVALPSPKLSLQDRKRILSHQLGEFILCYNKETEHMVKKQEKSDDDGYVNFSVFQEYITTASESSLEEVLTFFTQKNKSASVFLGSKEKAFEKHIQSPDFSRDPTNTLPVVNEDSSAQESSFSTGKFSSDPNIKAGEKQPSVSGLPADQQEEVTGGKPQPEMQSSRQSSPRCSKISPTLEREPAHSPPVAASAPLHCPPPPPPPQPPSYAQSLAKSQFCHPDTFTGPPAYISSNLMTQPPRLAWISTSSGPTAATATQPAPALRRIQSFTTSTSHSGTSSSVPSATHIYSQKLSRPTSAGEVIIGGTLNRLKSGSATTFKGLHNLSAQAQANQQSFISALQKLAEKQVNRHCGSSSHINLLTQHLTRLNLSNKMLNTTNPASIRPMKSFQLEKDPLSASNFKPLKEEESTWTKQMQNGLDAEAKRHHHPNQTSFQLQFAVRQLQQQRLKSFQFSDQGHSKHQPQFPEEARAYHSQVSTKPPTCPPSTFLQSNPNHGRGHHNGASPPIAPKPPRIAREGQTRKTASKRLIKQMSSESPAAASGSQQEIYEGICGKTGQPVYRKLLHDEDSSHR